MSPETLTRHGRKCRVTFAKRPEEPENGSREIVLSSRPVRRTTFDPPERTLQTAPWFCRGRARRWIGCAMPEAQTCDRRRCNGGAFLASDLRHHSPGSGRTPRAPRTRKIDGSTGIRLELPAASTEVSQRVEGASVVLLAAQPLLTHIPELPRKRVLRGQARDGA
jgi:hypothetical protein